MPHKRAWRATHACAASNPERTRPCARAPHDAPCPPPGHCRALPAAAGAVLCGGGGHQQQRHLAAGRHHAARVRPHLWLGGARARLRGTRRARGSACATARALAAASTLPPHSRARSLDACTCTLHMHHASRTPCHAIMQHRTFFFTCRLSSTSASTRCWESSTTSGQASIANTCATSAATASASTATTCTSWCARIGAAAAHAQPRLRARGRPGAAPRVVLPWRLLHGVALLPAAAAAGCVCHRVPP